MPVSRKTTYVHVLKRWIRSDLPQQLPAQPDTGDELNLGRRGSLPASQVSYSYLSLRSRNAHKNSIHLPELFKRFDGGKRISQLLESSMKSEGNRRSSLADLPQNSYVHVSVLNKAENKAIYRQRGKSFGIAEQPLHFIPVMNF